VQRVAATQAKVAVRAAQEKKARAIADVWAAIATRKRSREQDCGETKEAGPRATQHRQDDGTEMTTEGLADVRGKQEKVVRRRMAGLPPRNGNGKKNRRAPKRRKLRRAQSNRKKTTEQKEPRTQMQK